MIIEATRTDLAISDVPGNEVFPVEEFGEFRIRLINGDGGDRSQMDNVVDFVEWVKVHHICV